MDDAEAVYFLTDKDTGRLLRIGYSTQVGRRVTSQSHLDLVAALPATREVEKRLHEYFRADLEGRDDSTYVGSRVWEYVEWLVKIGYAATTLEDVPHMVPAVWDAITPDRTGSRSIGDVCDQPTLFALPPRERVALAASVAYHQSGSDEWFTPPEIVEAARTTLGGIDTDPASCPAANRTVRARTYWSKQQSGLDPAHPWTGSVWMNPPYADLAGPFVERLLRELRRGFVKQAIALLNGNAMTAKWFAPIYPRASALLLTNGRLRFRAGTTGQAFSSPSTGSVIVGFGVDVESFASSFGPFGAVLTPYRSEACDRLPLVEVARG